MKVKIIWAFLIRSKAYFLLNHWRVLLASHRVVCRRKSTDMPCRTKSCFRGPVGGPRRPCCPPSGRLGVRRLNAQQWTVVRECYRPTSRRWLCTLSGQQQQLHRQTQTRDRLRQGRNNVTGTIHRSTEGINLFIRRICWTGDCTRINASITTAANLSP